MAHRDSRSRQGCGGRLRPAVVAAVMTLVVVAQADPHPGGAGATRGGQTRATPTPHASGIRDASGVPGTPRGRRTGLSARPRLTTGSLKPDWRGTDLGNMGTEAVNGPATTPSQVFAANPGHGTGVTQGIDLDSAGAVLFTTGDGFVYSYNPATGVQNWVVSAGSSTFGSDAIGAASAPVASGDGNVYLTDDTGHFFKINAATGASTPFLTYGARVQQTLKVDDATGRLFFGGQDHYINSYSTAGATVYSVAGSSSTQDATLAGCAGATSSNPLFYGEGALDANDTFYVASVEPKTGGPRGCGATILGTLYKVSPTGTLLANKPLAGAVVGAVVLTTNPITPADSAVVVATKAGYVEAFDAATMGRLWAVKVANASLNASPAVDAARGRVYVADTADSLHALSLATGAPDPSFNGSGVAALNGGTQSSPIVDADGNVYIVDSSGTLYSFAPTGATRYSLNTTVGTGFFSPAIGVDGTIYVGGNLGQVGGFAGAASATQTAAAHQSATAGAAATAGTAATATAGAPTTGPTATPSGPTTTPLPTVPVPTATLPPPPGTDLHHLNTANAHYIAASNGLTELRLYNAPVGLPDATGWHLRDPGLRPAVPVVASPSPRASVSPASPGAATSPVPLGTRLPLARQRAGAGVAVPTLPVVTPGVPATTVALTDTGVVTATGPLTPAALPFGLHLAPTANSPALASLTNEDGVSLTLGLAAINGVAPAAVPGVVGASGEAITYTAPVAAAPAALALRPTVSGLDLRLVLHNAAEAGLIVLAPILDPRTRLVQEGGGDLRVTRTVTDYTDDGRPFTQTLPEYAFSPPLVRDSAPDADAHTSPVSLTLTTTAAGLQGVALRLDPAWLNDPGRVYPVRVDLPLATAFSATRSGWFGAVSSCVPDVPVGQTAMAVGTRGSCVYHGQAYFDATTLLPDTPILSATLRLYTPDQTGPTGVRVYQNAPAATYGQLYYPTWATAAPLVTGSVGLGQSGSDGRWQSWDVTDIVRQWVRHARTNTGLTLVKDGTLVRVAAPLGAGDGSPAVAPYLDIVYGPRPAVSPLYSDYVPPATTAQAGVAPHVHPHLSSRYSDGAYSVVGMSGTFGVCSNGTPFCDGACNTGYTCHATAVDQVANLYGAYVRVTVSLRCLRGRPGIAWWGTSDQHPILSNGQPVLDTQGHRVDADPSNVGSIYDIMRNVYADRLIPIVTFGTPQGAQCSRPYDRTGHAYMTPAGWESQARDFINTMPADVFGQLVSGQRMTYFEIANEVNGDPAIGYGPIFYPPIFTAAAHGLQDQIARRAGNDNAHYRILTSGLINPTATFAPVPQSVQPSGYCTDNYTPIAFYAINQANTLYPASLPLSPRLGFAIHPYHYNTSTTTTF